MSRGPQKQFDREQALERAMEFFWAHGYEGSGVTALLEHMGIGRQSLYDTFGDKRSLFLEALNHYFGSRVGPAIARLRAPGSPLGNIRKLFAYYREMAAASDQAGCLVGNSIAALTQDPDVTKLLDGYLSSLEDAFADNLTRAKQEGELGSKLPPRDLARFMVNTIQGMALLSKVRDRVVSAAVMKTTLAVLEGRS